VADGLAKEGAAMGDAPKDYTAIKDI